ncbi:Tetrapyrrole biosynthesis uroporphyrinogen III synthase [Lasiodiplodia theobromae]|uniref:Tetrapyrrole biosynthesis uroporphyrinogen III synthase n=1 Tax=Lasiodiplodia theobromae TaxID=45133 RepID=A0A8H7ISQ4_9PEZI|nr:Uroporphyrinogen-iii synthase [Lasiodiplodia theobromae]KAF4536253.1 Uroporphyrinogen-iii synthase [Lasiodiplodia theobromae]KAF9630859.1 Tetrapyrrole biosynthesis uroporphyrinogen III synthase [Lasiodiplodia theobromae]
MSVSSSATAAAAAFNAAAPSDRKVPVVLLKTKSTPTDGYEEFFAAAGDGRYDPVFVPVLEHRFRADALKQLRADIAHGGFTGAQHAKYGAIIFTSQRAVEAFTQVVQDLRREGGAQQQQHDMDALLPASLPLYVVGPATARGLRALGLQCPILGEESGNGEVLAKIILDDYNRRVPPPPALGGAGGKRKADLLEKLPILFLVGEQRRDIIPKTLQAPDLPAERYTAVDEVVVYETAEMQSFRQDFAAVVAGNRQAGAEQQWVVVFSPTGGKAMLETLGKGEGSAKTPLEEGGLRTCIATIGPTTRDYLVKCGYEPDVCAKKPSPEGVGNGIEDFMHGFAAN